MWAAGSTTGRIRSIQRCSRSSACRLRRPRTRRRWMEWRAANRTRPTVTVGAELTITGENAAELTLSGLIISGGTLHVVATPGNQRLQRLRLVHCTLVPGLALAPNGSPL